MKAGTLTYRVIEKLLGIYFDFICKLRINRLPWMGSLSRRTFSFLWKLTILKSLLDFSPIRNFVDLSQLRDPLGGHVESPISVVIPCHSKDAELLFPVLEGLERNCSNQISEVIIVSPNPEKLNIESRLNLRLLSDSEVINHEMIEIIKTSFDSSQFGWVIQQIIKIQTALRFAANGNILVLDSDTILTKPTLFVKDKIQILQITREFHRQYVTQYQNFSGTNFDTGFTYVTHHQLWQRDILESIWGEEKLLAWLLCADQSSSSSLSEYQTYGSILVERFPERFKYAIWGNIELSRVEAGTPAYRDVIRAFPAAHSVSVHSYS